MRHIFCIHCGTVVDQDDHFCASCGVEVHLAAQGTDSVNVTSLSGNKIEKCWTPSKNDGDLFVNECSICGKTIWGKGFSLKTVSDNLSSSNTVLNPVRVKGVFCNNCGYTVCWGNVNQHLKELKPYKWGRFLCGTCPGCGKSLLKDNTQRDVVNAKLDLVMKEDRCMLCGKIKPLQDVAVYSGVSSEGGLSKGTQDLLFGVIGSTIISAYKKKKIVDVQEKHYRICDTCSTAKKPEEHTKISRSIQTQITYIIQREPFAAEDEA